MQTLDTSQSHGGGKGKFNKHDTAHSYKLQRTADVVIFHAIKLVYLFHIPTCDRCDEIHHDHGCDIYGDVGLYATNIKGHRYRHFWSICIRKRSAS